MTLLCHVQLMCIDMKKNPITLRKLTEEAGVKVKHQFTPSFFICSFFPHLFKHFKTKFIKGYFIKKIKKSSHDLKCTC